MTREEAILQLENSIKLWNEFWGGAQYAISEIEAIECLINEVENK